MPSTPNTTDSRDPTAPSRAVDQSRHARQFRQRYGPRALVVGAAEGLGAAMSQALAQRGLQLCLVDHQGDKLSGLAERLTQTYAVAVQTVQADLADPSVASALPAQLGDHDFGFIAIVAAVVPIGAFVDRALDDHLRAVTVNCAAPIALLHPLLPSMQRRGRGGIVLFSSLAGFQWSAQISTYAATKAFTLVLAESLAAELGPRGLDVAACCPGATRTPALLRSAPRVEPRPFMTPEAVVETTLRSLGRRTVIVPGFMNWAARAFMTVVGRKNAVATFSRATRRMYPPRRPA